MCLKKHIGFLYSPNTNKKSPRYNFGYIWDKVYNEKLN